MTSDKDYPWIDRSRERLAAQLRNMIRLRNQLNPQVKVYLVVSSDLNSTLKQEISALGIELVRFPVFDEQ